MKIKIRPVAENGAKCFYLGLMLPTDFELQSKAM